MAKSNEELVRELIESFSHLKQKMEDPNYIQLENAIELLIQGQREMKEDMSELKKRLLNPYDGAIVEIRKNTEFRQEQEKRQKELDTLLQEHKELMKWKTNTSKIFIAIIGSLGAVLTWFLSNIFNK